METKAALVGSNRAVELHSVTLVHLHLALIIYPGNTEHYYSFRLYKPFKKSRFFVLWMLFHYGFKRSEDLCCRLMKLRFARIVFLKIF